MNIHRLPLYICLRYFHSFPDGMSHLWGEQRVQASLFSLTDDRLCNELLGELLWTCCSSHQMTKWLSKTWIRRKYDSRKLGLEWFRPFISLCSGKMSTFHCCKSSIKVIDNSWGCTPPWGERSVYFCFVKVNSPLSVSFGLVRIRIVISVWLHDKGIIHKSSKAVM